MKVFYTCSVHGKNDYQNYYDLVLKTIEAHCDDIISPELGNYIKVLPEREKAKLKDLHRIHYQAIRKGIEMSDIVIMEISKTGFQLGHEASLAIQNKKPVLCLSIYEDMSLKIDSPYFFGAKYNSDNIDEIISEFVRRFSKNVLNNRFNMFLSSSQLMYINEKAKSKKLSNSAYIRWLIDKDRGDDDEK